MYSTYDDDVAQPSAPVREAGHSTNLTVISFRCDLCGKAWDSWRKLSVHEWSKHGVRSNIRQFVGEVSVCIICGTNFGSRARLIKHLLERRIRSKCRNVSCQQAFLDSNPSLVPGEILKDLELRDSKRASSARREGHTSIIAEGARNKPSVLKRASKPKFAAPKARAKPKSTKDPKPARRLKRKTPFEEAVGQPIRRRRLEGVGP